MPPLAHARSVGMEQKYWLKRKRASVAKANDADSAEARLIHFDLAGRYALKAVDAAPSDKDTVDDE